MKLTDKGFTLECSGRTFTAHCNIIGVDDDGELTAGYDNGLGPDWKDGPERDFSPAERMEIAEYMIHRWTTYRDEIAATVSAGARRE